MGALTADALHGRSALVTGASSGIGRAIAVSLAGQGAAVCLVGRDASRLEAAAAEAAEAGGRVHAAAVDLTLDDAPATLEAECKDRFGGLDILVHCAGVIKHNPLQDSLVADFDAQFQANVRAPYALTQALAPMLVAAGGDVVFVNSSIVRNPRAGAAQFSATQHALEGVADCIRQEFNPSGVRVLSIFPGRTATPRQALLYDLDGQTYQPDRLLQPADVAQTVVHSLALPRSAEITEIHIRPAAKS